MKTQIIEVLTKNGKKSIPAIWCGAHLAVHHPLNSSEPDGLSKAPRYWSVTHKATGYLAGPSIDATQRQVLALAKLWDAAFHAVTVAGDAKGWQWGEQWAEDIRRTSYGKPLIGPRQVTPLERLNSAGTAAEVEAAVRAAMGYQPVAADEADAQYPAEVTRQTAGAGAVRRNAETAELEFWWLPRGGNYPLADAMALAGWYTVPAMGDVENWCLGSVAETPCGDSVEPDHPDAWPCLLGLI